MTDFEIQRQLRALNAPRAPQADLWPVIATRLGANAAVPLARRRRGLPLAAAAALLLAVVTGTLVFGLREQAATRSVANTTTNAPLGGAHDFSRAPGGDPRLLGAAIVLDTAHAELEQALEERPDAVFLVSLLNRTNARRMKLEQFGASAG